MLRTLIFLAAAGLMPGQDTPPPPPPIPVVPLDVAPLAPPDLASPYASPRDGARHRFQFTLAQLQSSRNVQAAIQGFADAFAADRTYAAAAFNLAVLDAIGEKWPDALAAMEEAARLDPAGLDKLAAPSIERFRKLSVLESTPEGKLQRKYDEALYPVLQKLPKLSPADAMQEIADVGRIDPKRWEAPALLAGLNRSYDVAAQFLEIAARNTRDPQVKARLEKALEAARRELRYGAARADADAAADRGEYEKAAGLYENAWAAMPARASNGMEAASSWLLHDDTAHASADLARLRDSGDAELSQLAGAMLAQLEPIEPAAKSAASDARDFFKDPGSAQPAVLSDLIPAVDTSAMELLVRPLPKLVADPEPVVMLAALSMNPADAASAAVPEQPVARGPEPPPPAPVEHLANTAEIGDGRARRPVQVTSQPAAARIFVGDALNPACETPCTIQAAAGTYKLSLSLAGYRSEDREVQVAAKPVDLDVPLAQIRGNVVIDAPAGSALKVNGTPVPNPAPVELSLIPGLHRISVETGGAVRERTINVKPEARLQWKP